MTTATVDQETLSAEDEMASLLKEFGKDLDVGKLGETGDKKGADIIVSLYHAIDGHEWRGPLYMTTGEGGALSLLKYRFTPDQVQAMSAGPEWVGKRVWFNERQKSSIPVGKVMCRFHVGQTEERKAEAREQGIEPFCRHKTSFLTEYAEDRHVMKRHPQTYKYLTSRSEQDQRTSAKTQAEALSAQTQALLAIAESLKASQTPQEPAQSSKNK